MFCQGLLAAVVVKDDRAFGNRRLHAVPASVLAAEPDFARLIADDTGTAPALEAVELAEFLQPPQLRRWRGRPGRCWPPAVEAVEFTGRGEELAELTAWRDGGEGLSVMLVAGEGGQGKTRLARQFAAHRGGPGGQQGSWPPASGQPGTRRAISAGDRELAAAGSGG